MKFNCLYLLAGVSLVSACASNSTPDNAIPDVALPEVTLFDDTGLYGEQASDALSANIGGPDADNDGIGDAADRCADTSRGSLVDEAGCEIVIGVIEGLKFAPNETRLSVDSRVVLSKLVDVILRYPDVTFTVDGHTDNRGPAAANLELSKQRVLSVVRYMVSNGVDPEQLKPFGYGESRPRAANVTEDGREQNRRIEINIKDPLL